MLTPSPSQHTPLPASPELPNQASCRSTMDAIRSWTWPSPQTCLICPPPPPALPRSSCPSSLSCPSVSTSSTRSGPERKLHAPGRIYVVLLFYFFTHKVYSPLLSHFLLSHTHMLTFVKTFRLDNLPRRQVHIPINHKIMAEVKAVQDIWENEVCNYIHPLFLLNCIPYIYFFDSHLVLAPLLISRLAACPVSAFPSQMWCMPSMRCATKSIVGSILGKCNFLIYIFPTPTYLYV